LDNTLFGGIAVDRASLKADLFYYAIPSFLIKKAKIGARVIVPFGEKNDLRSGFILKITTAPPPFKVKEIIEIIEEPLFSKEIYDLLLFTSNTFLISLNSLVNRLIRTTSSAKVEKYAESLNLKSLEELYSSSKGIKKELAKILLEKKFISIESLKRKFKGSLSRYLSELQEKGNIAMRNIEVFSKIRTLKLNETNITKITNSIDDAYKKRALLVCQRLIDAKGSVLDETSLLKRIKDGKYVLDQLVSKNIISEYSVEGGSKINNYKLETVFGEGLEERSAKIIEKICLNLGPSERALVIFPEIVLLNRVKNLYSRAFGDKLAIWEGKGKLKLIEQVKAGKTIILATPFAMFLDIPMLKILVLEEANSKYFKPSEFVDFDVTTVALRKAYREKVNLILSSVIPDENIFYLHQSGLIENLSYQLKAGETKIIDMRREFKRRNSSMLSSFLARRIKEVLKNNGNVALLINRKPYSTFVMCRECGYVLRCPVCNSPLYFDIETKKLFCPICGHEERLPERCPRCGSINIHYFGGGIQKLSKELVALFPDAQIIELISDSKKRKPLDSINFEKTIFIGTEFLISNLILSNVDLFGFVSIDTFLEHFMFDAASNTIRVFSEAAADMNANEIIVQTYLPEHYALKTIKSLDYEKFFREELYLRKELGYPPYKNVILINVIGKEGAIGNFNKFLNSLEEKLKGQVEILGPALSYENYRKGYQNYEATIKTSLNPQELKEEYFNFISSANLSFKVRVFPVPDIAFK
jgi:primosomal protein N' (replication factor Y)